MGKRVYNKPMLITEAFVPQEYVAACAAEEGATSYFLQCTAEDSKIDLGIWGVHDVVHSSNGCKRPTAFRVDVDDKTMKIVNIYEAGNNSGYWDEEGPCENIQVNGVPASSVALERNGAYSLTWTTDVGYDMPHSGTLKLTTPISINHS